jgi:TadE-like protein
MFRSRLALGGSHRGQALVEFAMVVPIAAFVIVGIISVGLWVFYQQQATNVAREAARYAAIHSSEAACPTSSWRDPQAPPQSYLPYPYHCDGPNNPADPYPWPRLTDHARGYVWGTDPAKVYVNACWSGYRAEGSDPTANADWPATESDGAGGVVQNTYVPCTISGLDPVAQTGSLGCGYGLTTLADDSGSDIPGNEVTAYACFAWTPPMAGFLMIPEAVTMRAVVTEVIHDQQ